MANNEISLIVSAQDKASATLKNVSSGLTKLGGVAGSIAKVVAGATVAMAGATVAFGVASVKAYADAEASQVRFATAMKNIAKASDAEIESLRKQQLALQRTTRFEDDAIASGQGFLATFQMSASQIEYLTPKLLDMAEGLRDSTGATMGLEQASNMLGKAIQLGTVGMLAKAGVTIPGTTKAMQDLFKKNFELASIQERVLMIGELVEGNFKGQAVAAGQTLTGSVERLKNEFGNLKESVGQALAVYLVPLLTKLNEWATSEPVTAKITEIANQIQRIPEYWRMMTDAITLWKEKTFADTNWIWVWIKDVFVPMFKKMKEEVTVSFYMIQSAIEPIKPQLLIMAKFFGVVLVGAIVATVAVISSLIAGMSRMVAIIVTVVSAIIQGLTWALEKVVTSILKVIDAWNRMKDLLSRGVNAVINVFKHEKGGDGEKALGGAVKSGGSYLVGENRPEVFVPSQSGNIRQTGQVGGKEITINFNNVSVRGDGDIDNIIRKLRAVLNKEQELYQLGAL